MNFLVFGAGAVGSWLGAKLAHGGHEVALVGREPFVQAVSREGLRAALPSGETWQLRNVRAAVSAAQCAMMQFDAALVCVKAYDVDEAIRELRPLAERLPDLVFLTFQNGVGAEEKFAQAFGAARVIAATTTTPISHLAPGAVKVEKLSGGEGLAFFDGRRETEDGNASSSSSVFRLPSALAATLYPDPRAMKWSKLFLNVMGNAASAVTGKTVAQIYADPLLFRQELGMLKEIIAVMRMDKIGFVNLPGAPAFALAQAVRFLPAVALQPVFAKAVAGGRGDKRPSLFYDAQNHTGRSEVNWLNGAVVEAGRRVGVPTPINQKLTEEVMALVTRDGRRETGVKQQE